MLFGLAYRRAKSLLNLNSAGNNIFDRRLFLHRVKPLTPLPVRLGERLFDQLGFDMPVAVEEVGPGEALAIGCARRFTVVSADPIEPIRIRRGRIRRRLCKAKRSDVRVDVQRLAEQVA